MAEARPWEKECGPWGFDNIDEPVLIRKTMDGYHKCVGCDSVSDFIFSVEVVVAVEKDVVEEDSLTGFTEYVERYAVHFLFALQQHPNCTTADDSFRKHEDFAETFGVEVHFGEETVVA